MKLRMSVASATPLLDLLEVLVLGVGWLIGIPGVGTGGVISLTCGRERESLEVRSFDLLGALDCGGRQDRYQRVLYWRGAGVSNQTRA